VYFDIIRQKYSYFIADSGVNNNNFVEEENKQSKITHFFTKGKGNIGLYFYRS
jgi:hypothetical protein